MRQAVGGKDSTKNPSKVEYTTFFLDYDYKLNEERILHHPLACFNGEITLHQIHII